MSRKTQRLKALAFLTSLAMLATAACRTEPTPPITLKFVGIVSQPSKPKIAVLMDGSSPPQYGKEGDVVFD
jgi:hypothetical protein